MKIKSYSFPIIVILLGVLFTVYLQFHVPNGVYFSGDAGLKALLAKQFGAGNLQFDLALPSETWASDLWEKGLLPFEEPFVYNQDSKYYITFPYTFPLVTAPFYALFGYRGFYLIPLVSTWLTWLIFYRACRNLNLDNKLTAVGLAVLIFSSYLSLYSAMYWEHTLAVVLAFYGISNLLMRGSEPWSKVGAISSGIAMGLSVWFRPEFLCLVAILCALVVTASLVQFSQFNLLNRFLDKKSLSFLTQRKVLFLASLLGTVCLFFVLNQLIYGHPLGIHAIQVIEESLSDRLSDAWNNFRGLGSALFEYLPITFFPVIYLLFSLFSRKGFKLNIQFVVVYLICLLFVIGVSFLVPAGTAGLIAGGKQWGPRFLLILVPIISWLAIEQLKLILAAKPVLKYSGITLFSLLFIIGVHKNIFDGIPYLQASSRVAVPTVEFLKSQPTKVVAVSHQYVAQGLTPTLEDKFFFKVEDVPELLKISQVLTEQDMSELVYICYPHRECPLPEEPGENLQFSTADQDYRIEFSSLGQFSKQQIYQVSIIEQ